MTGVSAINDYSLILDKAKVGEIVTSLFINARHTETTTVVGTNSRTSATPNNGAGFIFNCQWDFRTS